MRRKWAALGLGGLSVKYTTRRPSDNNFCTYADLLPTSACVCVPVCVHYVCSDKSHFVCVCVCARSNIACSLKQNEFLAPNQTTRQINN